MNLPRHIDFACKDLVELVTAYLCSALSREERTTFEQHLHVCPGCTMFVSQMRATAGFAAALGRGGQQTPRSGGPSNTLLAAFRRRRENTEGTGHVGV